MSECLQQIHRAIQSYDDSELRSSVAGLADTARRDHRTVESLIVDLKFAVNSVPASALRDRERRELRDMIVRIAIRAYYDTVDFGGARRGWR
jgi:hypothetical protein